MQKKISRGSRLAGTIRDIVAEFVRETWAAERFGLLTVLSVEVARGGDSARVRISAFKNGHTLEKELQRKIMDMQRAVNMHIPHAPRLMCEVDRTGALLAGLPEGEAVEKKK